MKRSTFLKTLGMTAAAAFCNNPLWKTPSFALPAPASKQSLLDLPPLPEQLRGDIAARLLSDPMTLEFARDVIIPWTAHVTPPAKAAREHCALHSPMINLGSQCPDDVAGMLLINIRYLVEEFVRERHSNRTYGSVLPCYYDPLPLKRRRDGVRISPYVSVATTTGERMEYNPAYKEAPIDHGIQRPIKVRYALSIDIKAVPLYPPDDYEGHWKPCLGWFVRAVMMMAELKDRGEPIRTIVYDRNLSYERVRA